MPTIANPNVISYGPPGDPNRVGPAPSSDNVAGLPAAPVSVTGILVDQSARAEARLDRIAGVQMRPQATDLRTTVRRYDWINVRPVTGDSIVLLEEDRTTQMAGVEVLAPQWVQPSPRRLEPSSWRGD